MNNKRRTLDSCWINWVSLICFLPLVAACNPDGGTNKQEKIIVDIDGNTYKTVEIGDLRWMAEDLKTTRYNDGSPIPLVENYDQWAELSTPAYS